MRHEFFKYVIHRRVRYHEPHRSRTLEFRTHAFKCLTHFRTSFSCGSLWCFASIPRDHAPSFLKQPRDLRKSHFAESDVTYVHNFESFILNTERRVRLIGKGLKIKDWTLSVR